MACDVDKKELEAVIREVLDKLVKHGLIKAPANTHEFVAEIAENLKNDPNSLLTKDDLHKEHTLKALGLACVAALTNKFDYRLLFANQKDIETKDLATQFKSLYADMLKLTPAFKSASQHDLDMLDEKLDEIAELMAKNYLKHPDKEMLCENAHVLDRFVQDFTTEIYYGGNGNTAALNFGDLIGNPKGYVLTPTGGATGLAVANELNNPVGADPTGNKSFLMLCELSSDPGCSVLSLLREEGLLPSGPAPKLEGG